MSDFEFYMMVTAFIAICVVIFLILRTFFCWYWKISRRVRLMEEQNELLREIVDQLRSNNHI